jgi:hypothetical protein
VYKKDNAFECGIRDSAVLHFMEERFDCGLLEEVFRRSPTVFEERTVHEPDSES